MEQKQPATMLACPLKIKTRHAEDEAEAILTD